MKILKCCTNIYFNKQCLKHNVTPQYIKITIPITSPAAIHTHSKVNKIRIKYEIKFLHLKKEKINEQLYNIHLKLTHEWNNLWHIILEQIDTTLNKGIQKKYRTLNRKLETLKNAQHTKHNTPNHNTTFYPRIANNSDIKFSEEEFTLLHKGLKYNLHYKHKHWITNLALEAETAINLLPPADQEHIRYQVTKNIQQLSTCQKYQGPQNTQDQKEMKLIQQIKKKIRRMRRHNYQSRQGKRHSNSTKRSLTNQNTRLHPEQ